ncbi:hypothetical protein TPHA_0L01030 [Tetrapisispora phaffii CBS 4417]|uniref:Kynureninase n=1 Tax=Tetrapisispora phaffii (strain ATCC 24235 / CBS 4417 / NBRC 1672 / NRRL Y-8282 / UCD 70-5) TaxID=1071381 RepID=G8BZY2_TETPH|nr:hypothetical protein TPHA_0L01030 [Tetrapisispora phaffii CBS 4417]CCE65460.1 hypothetical protein TPHA_0L01030 [Tetrapisispora phaffii CBS 4417]
MPFAKALDETYPNDSRQEFHIPTFKSLGIKPPQGKLENDEVIYLCGNSLGLMPKSTKTAILNELDAWKDRGVVAHFNRLNQETTWAEIDLPTIPLMCRIVGGEENEVAVMNSLTVNLNSLLVSFYKPNGRRNKILMETGAFPSDYYALLNQCYLNGLNPEGTLIRVQPKENEFNLDLKDIKLKIQEHKETLSLVCLPGIQYYTGQLFDIESITKFVNDIDPNIIVCWDLAHAVGNVELKLHEWNVDIAVWCSYKYLNSGPGSIGGLFVHNKHTQKPLSPAKPFQPRLAGWWGNDSKKRFEMKETFEPIEGALGFRQSNPSVIDVVSLHNSLKIFEKYGNMGVLRHRSQRLTRFLIEQLQESPYISSATNDSRLKFKIITPIQSERSHGAQISLFFYVHRDCKADITTEMELVSKYLYEKGVIVDERKPNVIRIAPAILYNTFEEVKRAIDILNSILEQLNSA